MLTKEVLAKTPAYDPKDPKRMNTSPFVLEVFSNFGLQPYFLRAVPAASPKAPSEGEKHKNDR